MTNNVNKNIQTDKFIGIPYVVNGRELSGLDCYGLVHLIYKEELGINLPSFVEEGINPDRTQELIAQYKEGWEQTDTPQAGDVVIFKILGVEAHIALAVSSTHFIHARQGQNSAIESFDSPRWKTRFVGSYKYSPVKSVVLNGIPHPLRTERITTAIPPGTNVVQLEQWILKEYKIDDKLHPYVKVLVNGVPIPDAMKEVTVLQDSDCVEYRVLPQGGDGLRTVLTLAVVIAVAYATGGTSLAAGGVAGGLGWGASLGGALGIGTAAGTALATIGLTAVGMALVDAIAPVRIPSSNFGDPTNPGSAEQQLIVNGGSNRATPYGSIPFVLGNVRITPPIGANTYNLFSADGKESYLRMLLVWGYGPLHVDESTLRIGELPMNMQGTYSVTSNVCTVTAVGHGLSAGTERLVQFTSGGALTNSDIYKITSVTANTVVFSLGTANTSGNCSLYNAFDGVDQSTQNRIVEPTAGQLAVFNDLYGTDKTQIQSGVELTCDGWDSFPVTSGLVNSTTLTVPATYLTGSMTAHQRQYYPEIGIWAREPVASSVVGTTATFTPLYSVVTHPVYYSYISQNAGTPGPWLSASSTDGEVSDFTIAIHFPQGCRKIASKGSSSGQSFASPVMFQIEYKKASASEWIRADLVEIGATPVKDAFSWTRTIDYSSSEDVQVRIRRLTGTGTGAAVDENYQWLFTSTLVNTTFSRNALPAVDPLNCKIAKTAFKIKASDQLNGQIEGINAVVWTYGKSWNGSAWVDGNINNPAALFRHVLEHPANPRRVIDAAAKINLTQIQYWHDYCTAKGFTFNSVVGSQRSVLDILKDICAAGRASPAMVDGKWTVVIDEAKANIVQHFSPHNSWGFEGTKALPRIPDGLRVTFINQAKDWQEDETIVYATAQSASTAALLESISVPGVTTLAQAQDHARWHMAQANLRPESYTLNTDIEYIVCNRGDRVKVMHDVPMWGLGSGRIKNKISTTVIELTETLPIDFASNYSIRFRSKTGGSNDRVIQKTFTPTFASRTSNVVTVTSAGHPLSIGDSVAVTMTGVSLNANPAIVTAVTTDTFSYTLFGTDVGNTAVTGTVNLNDGYYSKIKITVSADTTAADNDDLFLFGLLNQEAQDCIVLSIEPTDNKSARISLVDYGVTDTYNIFTDYLDYTNAIAFESQISIAPKLLIQSFGTKVPTITGFISDERVMERIAAGVFEYKMQVSYTNAIDLPATVAHVEFQWDYQTAIDGYGTRSKQVEYNLGSVTILEVEEGAAMKVRCRYVGTDGRTGLWTAWGNHTILGKTNPPSNVTNFSISSDNLTGKLILKWTAAPEIDIRVYEVRTDTNWGNTTNLVFLGDAITCQDSTGTLGIAKTYYIKALDYANNYSITAASVSYTLARPVTYTGTVTYSYADTSLTDSTVTFKWTAAPTGVFAIDAYEITLSRPSGGATSVQEIKGLTWTTNANWVGDATVTIKSKDIIGNLSAASSTITTITKVRPVAPSGITAANFTVSNSQVIFDWVDVSKPTNGLPVGGYEIRKVNSSWGVANSDLVWKGSASNALLKNIVNGDNTWYINTFDTDNIYALSGTTVTFTASKPSVATSLTPVFNNTVATQATVTINWIAPVVTTFSVAKYKVRLTRPDATFLYETVDATTWTVTADWVGDAAVAITTVDVIGNESASNATLTINKLAPNTPGVIDVNVKEKTVFLDWPDTTKTTLPIAGYELRTVDTGWGDSNYYWKGLTSAIEVVSLSEGSNTWYLKAYDTSGKYSTTARSVSQTVAAPAAPTIGSIVFVTTSATSSTVTVNWTGNKNTFDIARYNVSIVRGTGTVSAVVTGNSWTIPVDWTSNATFNITATDNFNLTSALASAVITKTAPVAPVSFVAAPNSTGLVLSWPNGTNGSLPIAGYELRATGSTPGGTDFIWKGTVNSVEIKTVVLGSNTWDLWAYDVDNRYSAIARPVSYTGVIPSVCNTLNAAFDTSLTNATATFTWVKPSTSVFGIARYQVSLTTTNPVRTLTSIRNTTDWTVTADWLGSGTFSVQAIDNMGFSSSAVTFPLTKLVPAQPGVFLSATPSGTTVELDWPDTVKTSLPVIGYELRSADSNWGSTGYIWKGGSSHNITDVQGTVSGTTLTWYLKAYDTDNRYSTSARSYSYTVNAPVNTSALTYRFEDTNLTSATIILSWNDTIPTFGLKHYEVTGTLIKLATTTAASALVTVSSTKGLKVGDSVTVGTTIPAGKTITIINSATQITLNDGTGVTAGTSVSTSFSNYRYTNSTTITLPADWLLDKTFVVKTIDLLNNKSTGVSATATKTLPNSATGFRAQVIDNNVLLYWNLPTVTTLPISHARIKKGATWNSAELIGDKSGTFTSINELIGGAYTYWLAIVDTDNNESSPVSLAATVSSPPDYIFNAEWTSTYSGTLSNAVIDSQSGYLVLPVNTTETFAGHFTGNSWTAPSDQITAGYPVYIQPGLTTGYYEEVFDYGAVLGSSQITVALSNSTIAGSPVISVDISTSLDGISYPTVFPSTYNAFGSSFRYVKVRVTVTQGVVGSICAIQNMTVRLDAKQKTDSGTVAMSLGGAQPQGNVSHDYIDLWIPGSLPTTQYPLVGTAGENSITNQAGPGGYVEPIWNCIDSDIALTNDGGWDSTYSTVDTTKGYLVAMFVNRTNTDGVTYFGTNTNSTVSSLAGVVNANPYFLSAVDMPAINTWYLVVGYVHEIGYGTTDTNISGIYNLSGTRLVAGTEFKFNSGTTMKHRCFHYDNPTNSGTIVQRMARPVIIPCTTAAATSTIAYLLQCATGYGAAVTPNQQFVDIISITATPQGTTPSTPLVDFNDIPYPKRFNIFNYNSAGSLVGGNVSHATRGY